MQRAHGKNGLHCAGVREGEHTLVWDTQLGGSGGGGGQGLCGGVGLINGAGKNERKPARQARGGRAMKRCEFGRVTWRRMRLLYRLSRGATSHKTRRMLGSGRGSHTERGGGGRTQGKGAGAGQQAALGPTGRRLLRSVHFARRNRAKTLAPFHVHIHKSVANSGSIVVNSIESNRIHVNAAPANKKE